MSVIHCYDSLPFISKLAIQDITRKEKSTENPIFAETLFWVEKVIKQKEPPEKIRKSTKKESKKHTRHNKGPKSIRKGEKPIGKKYLVQT